VSATAALLVVVLVWLAIGVVASLVMARRGHAPFTWGALGAALGPLVIPLALGSVRRERAPTDVALRQPVGGAGPVDVLVGIDGSAEARRALRAVVELLGPRLGRLTLATVVDFDTAESAQHGAERRRAEQHLEEAALDARAIGGDRVPGELLLAGRPATALVRHARENGYGLLAIGCRGHGASKLAFGSVASQLARAAEVPVFLVSG
jgi:nucleotide-binding universal stress UspA family protein